MTTDTPTAVHRRWYVKHPIIAASVVAGALALSGTAYAFWTNSGGGTGTSTSSAGLAALTVTQTGTISGMAPGSLAQDVNYTITNTATTPQYATSVTIAVGAITYTAAVGNGAGGTDNDAGTPGDQTWQHHAAGATAVGCSAADFTFVQPTALGVDLPGSGTDGGVTTYTRNGGTTYLGTKLSGTIAMDNEATNQDGCKGTTVALTFSLV